MVADNLSKFQSLHQFGGACEALAAMRLPSKPLQKHSTLENTQKPYLSYAGVPARYVKVRLSGGCPHVLLGQGSPENVLVNMPPNDFKA